MKKNTKIDSIFNSCVGYNFFWGTRNRFCEGKEEGFAFCESYGDESGNFHAFAEKR